MTKDDLVKLVAAMEPSELKATFTALAGAMSIRAEAVYDVNPQENGTLAQPYARISDALNEASMAFEPRTVPGLEEELVAQPTVASVVAKAKSPWGGR